MSWLDEQLESPKTRRAAIEEELLLTVSETFLKRMATLSMTKAELAARLGVSGPRVSKMFASGNFELRTVARILDVLGLELVIRRKR